MFQNVKVKEKKNCSELCSDCYIASSSNVTTSRIYTCYTVSVLLELVKSFKVYNVILNFDKTVSFSIFEAVSTPKKKAMNAIMKNLIL